MAQNPGPGAGNDSHSEFLTHLLSYPFVQDGVSTIKQNQYAQRSIELGDSAYRRLAQPVLPYLLRPYQYVSPYVQKADQMGDHTLSIVDRQFPAITKPTGELYAEAKNFVLFPYHKGMEGKDHVFGVYSTEFGRVGGQGVVTYGKALVSTVFIMTGECVQWAKDTLGRKKQEAQEAGQQHTE